MSTRVIDIRREPLSDDAQCDAWFKEEINELRRFVPRAVRMYGERVVKRALDEIAVARGRRQDDVEALREYFHRLLVGKKTYLAPRAIDEEALMVAQLLASSLVFAPRLETRTGSRVVA